MQTALNLEMFLSLILAVALGAIVGVEREMTHKPAGLRTHMLVSLGACLFTMMSTSFGAQPAQVAGGIVAGIGFIGAGTIWAEKDKVKGITTAASLWATAAIGLTVNRRLPLSSRGNSPRCHNSRLGQRPKKNRTRKN